MNHAKNGTVETRIKNSIVELKFNRFHVFNPLRAQDFMPVHGYMSIVTLNGKSSTTEILFKVYLI